MKRRWRRFIARVWPELANGGENDAAPMTSGQFRSSLNKVIVFVFTGYLVSAGTAYLVFHGSSVQDSKRCMSGVQSRLATADGLDRLRLTALPILPAASRSGFITKTQPAIDELLSQAAGQPLNAPLPPGAVTAQVREKVTDLARVRCHYTGPDLS